MGTFLPDRMLADLEVPVFVDEFEVGRLVIDPGQAFELRFSLPEAVSDRRAVGVRFRADEFVYRGSDLRRCVVFRLERVAIR